MSTAQHATSTWAIVAIDPTIADDLRAAGGPVYVADSYPGYPCRQCLRDAAVGDELVLVSYDPFAATSPYRCASPVFLHRTRCTPYESVPALPEQLTSRTLSVRAFDRSAMMLDAALIDGDELGVTIGRLLTDPLVDHLHLHNASRGCFAARVDRIGATAPV
ncbi:MAG: DUF1203 domain-containing protein [Ilumatobacteraceae bacterium]